MKVMYAYQQEMYDRVIDLFYNKGESSVLLQLPTGGGKTVTTANIVMDTISRGMKVGIFAHRAEIIRQLYETMVSYGIPTGIIAAGYKPQPNLPVQVGSVQTYIKRDAVHFDLLIFDEAHHADANTYKKIRSWHKDAKYLGVTATPYRINGKGLADCFDNIVLGKTVLELEAFGSIVPAEVYINPLDPTKLKSVGIVAGDYNEATLDGLMDNSDVNADVVDAYKQHAMYSKAIVFAVSVKHSKHLCERFNEEGIKAAHIDGKEVFIWKNGQLVKWDVKEAREKVIKMFGQGTIYVLCNVAIATEGTDIPGIETVILARPTKSLSLYLQAVGRGCRKALGKLKYILLDCANNVLEHGLPNEEHDWYSHFIGRPKKTDNSERLVRIIKDTGEEEIMSLEQLAIEFPEGIRGLRMERVDGIFRIGQFNECLKRVQQNQQQRSVSYYEFCNELKERNSYPNYMELLAIAKKLGYKQHWAWYEHLNWEKYAKKQITA